jgi:hypothetical protein
VHRHSAELAALLAPAGRQLRFILQTEDFGVTWRKVESKLPAFSFCTGACVCACEGGAWQRAVAGSDETLPAPAVPCRACLPACR